jgi:mannose-6-phosphate isomerase-like protein (cupin superfamily)
MKIIRRQRFTGQRAWDALDIATIDGSRCRLHWTDRPYNWQINDGQEVFAVLDGIVDMHIRVHGVEQIATLEMGDVFYAEEGCEHVAHPRGEAKILVVERSEHLNKSIDPHWR